ncbi:MAG: phosphate/phosphite/phosphonate ABC transporter substrate-binding protein [Negativicutes bacterium]|nr:phosphate/phosphite/phosphonate ABC transporter substrate-binding protein [Negativicutes bacterium]
MLLFLLLAGVLSGCGSSDKTPYIDFRRPAQTALEPDKGNSEQRPLRIGLATVLSPHETIGYYRKIAEYIFRQTGRPAVLIQRKTYAEVNMLLANGEVDIAFLSTGAFSAYRGMNEIELLVMAEHLGNSLYDAEVIVHKDSNIQSIEDLQGKTFAFTDPLSHSGHMVIEGYLQDRKTLPEKYFQRYFYTYSHDKSLWAVANKIADGASFDSQIYEYAQQKTPELTDNVRIIAVIGRAPTGPIVIRKSLNGEQKNELRNLFLRMHQDQDAFPAMQGLIIDKFVPPIPELYEPLRKLYDRTSAIL